MDPIWIHPGSKLDPSWIQPGSSLDHKLDSVLRIPFLNSLPNLLPEFAPRIPSPNSTPEFAPRIPSLVGLPGAVSDTSRSSLPLLAAAPRAVPDPAPDRPPSFLSGLGKPWTSLAKAWPRLARAYFSIDTFSLLFTFGFPQVPCGAIGFPQVPCGTGAIGFPQVPCRKTCGKPNAPQGTCGKPSVPQWTCGKPNVNNSEKLSILK